MLRSLGGPGLVGGLNAGAWQILAGSRILKHFDDAPKAEQAEN
jgi:hypothetical protein